MRRSRACSSTPPSTTGTPARTRRASTPATPAREYMFLDDTACNLASPQPHEVPAARTASSTSRPSRPRCRTVITAQEILVDNASYPTPAIDRNSHDYRPARASATRTWACCSWTAALPYDSRRGPRLRGRDHRAHARRGLRAVARASPRRWARSPATPKNAEPMLRVIDKHRQQRPHDRRHAACRRTCCRRRRGAGTRPTPSGPSTATATARSPCWPPPAPSAS